MFVGMRFGGNTVSRKRAQSKGTERMRSHAELVSASQKLCIASVAYLLLSINKMLTGKGGFTNFEIRIYLF